MHLDANRIYYAKTTMNGIIILAFCVCVCIQMCFLMPFRMIRWAVACESVACARLSAPPLICMWVCFSVCKVGMCVCACIFSFFILWLLVPPFWDLLAALHYLTILSDYADDAECSDLHSSWNSTVIYIVTIIRLADTTSMNIRQCDFDDNHISSSSWCESEQWAIIRNSRAKYTENVFSHRIYLYHRFVVGALSFCRWML